MKKSISCVNKIKLKKSGFKIIGVVMIYLTFNLLVNLLIPHASAAESIQNSYIELIQTYEECMQLESSVFQRLTFTLSDFQLKKGTRLKLILDDQLGRKWLYKMVRKGILKPGDPEFWSRSIAIYHLFTLFGLDTPQIHPITLNINGEETAGSIQKFISNKGTLDGIKPSELALDALTYLLKTHVIAWLTADHDANTANFLIISSGNNKIDEIVRVDNDQAFWFLGQDELRWDYAYSKFYTQLWKFYMSKDISLDLETNYEFIEFVTHLPDEFFKKLVLPVSKFDGKKIVDLIIDRKHNLPFDFKQFYSDLANERKETLMLSMGIDPKRMGEISNKICRKLENKIVELKKIEVQLQQKLSKQSEIKMIVSINGFRVLQKVYKYYRYKLRRSEKLKYVWPDAENKSLVEVCDEALQQLTDLKSSIPSKYEKIAIECYMEEIENIKTEGKPSYEFHEINKVVGNILGESL